MREKTKRLTVCAMLSALGVVLLYLGSMVEVLDMSMAVLVSLLAVFAVIEYGGAAPWLVYGVTGTLSLILMSHQPTPALMYLLFFGYYPILKEKLEKCPRILSWVLKEAVFHVALILMLVLGHLILTAPEGTTPWQMYLGLIALCELAFPLYDVALSRLITFYLVKLRHRFRMK